MTLAEILKALEAVEGNGSEMKSFLKKLLSEKDAAITTSESLANSAESRLDSIAKLLGCSTETVAESVKSLQTSLKEVDTLKTANETLQTKLTELDTAKKALERTSELKDFCGVVGADYKALSQLLPLDAQFKVTTQKQEDKDITVGVIVQGDKEVLFSDYVASDDKLKTFQSSIFNQQSNPPAPGKLPGGKSPDKSTSLASSLVTSMKEQQKLKAAKLLERNK